MRHRRWVLICALGLAACTTLDDQGVLAQQWSERFRQYQMIPAFVPREDIQVADVFLICNSTTQPSSNRLPLPIPTLLFRPAGVEAALYKHYRNSVPIPSTPLPTETSTGTALSGEQAVSKTGLLAATGGSGDVNRLRLAAFPSFFNVTARNVDVGALLPHGSVLAGAGLSTGDAVSVTVSISQAENVSLPLVESVGLIEAGLSVNEVRRFKALLDAAGKPGADGVRCVDGPAVFVVTEVYIARAIDFRLSLAAESAAKAKAAVDLSNRPNAAALVTAVKSALFASAPTVGAPASGMTPAAPASAAAAKPPSDVEQQIALALTRRLADAGAFGGVSDMGAAVSVSQGSFGTLNLRTRFLNPPVVGVRGAIITFDCDSMACKVGPSGGGLQAARTSMPLSGVGVEPSTEVTPVPPKDSAQNAGPAK